MNDIPSTHPGNPQLSGQVYEQGYVPLGSAGDAAKTERDSSEGGKEDVDQENHFYSAKMLVRRWKTGIWGPLTLNRVKSPPTFTTGQVPYKGEGAMHRVPPLRQQGLRCYCLHIIVVF